VGIDHLGDLLVVVSERDERQTWPYPELEWKHPPET
jgi:hypothetical protein